MTTQAQLQVIDSLIDALWYSYPPCNCAVTMAKCVTCDNGARGGGSCAKCIEATIATLVDARIAARLHKAIKNLRVTESTLPKDPSEDIQTLIAALWRNHTGMDTHNDQMCRVCGINVAHNHKVCSICALYRLKPLLKRGLAEKLHRAIAEVRLAEYAVRQLI